MAVLQSAPREAQAVDPEPQALAQAAVVQVEADPEVVAVEEAAEVAEGVVVADAAADADKTRAALITANSPASATAGAPSPLIQARSR